MQEHLGPAVLCIRGAARVQPLVPAEDGLIEVHLHGRPCGQQLQPSRGGEQPHLLLRAVHEPAALQDRGHRGDEDGEVEEEARGPRMQPLVAASGGPVLDFYLVPGGSEFLRRRRGGGTGAAAWRQRCRAVGLG